MSWTIVIHGGAGSISRTRLVHLEETEMRTAMRKAIAVVQRKMSGVLREVSPKSPDALSAAVEAVGEDPVLPKRVGTVLVAENEGSIVEWGCRASPPPSLFVGSCSANAVIEFPAAGSGWASVVFRGIKLPGFCWNSYSGGLVGYEVGIGVCEMEAAVMVGNTRSSGACCGIKTVKNPILLAEHIRVNTPHTMIGFEGAEQLAREGGLEIVDPGWFLEGKRERQLKIAAEKKKIVRDHDMEGDTIGALVLDTEGILAGAVSTGGVTNKFVGRIGDSPCIGSGLYATPIAAACGSGTGEHFVQRNLCGLICHAVQYGHMSLQEALEAAMAEMPDDCGGIIALDAEGHIAIDFNCRGFFRAYASSDETEFYGAFKD